LEKGVTMMLRRVWLFIKHYWYIPLVLLSLLVAFVVYRSKIATLLGLITSAQKDHQESLKKLTEVYDKRDAAKTKAADKHISNMDKIEKKKQIDEKEVGNKITSREQELTDDIDKIAEELMKEFGD
jgi:Skp family chaperone for outer membrane proteins